MANEQDEKTSTDQEEAEQDEKQDQRQDGDEAEQQFAKKKRSPEEELEYYEGRAARLRKKLGKDKGNTSADTEKAPSKPSELGYGELAYLTAKGIEGDAEIALVQTIMADTGKSLKDVVGSKYFQAELKEMKEEAAAKDAIPNKGGRSGGAARDSVDYWLKKGELPPNTPENQKLRQDVVNAKTKAAQSGSQFTNTPVVQ